ncbi:hypothetical protein [Fervidobacterium sp. 2310opik-2]|uniref:hypothetical protein n=1 Tax=Fervidobacterium sp. 2310opik-2 TaxID=1755815 RepID=UPI0013DF2629|nr:hypothetical protein [Fervidobacterium sp. 2310opik-2]KAF2962245.1 hypothetical protein AS161_04690 [Fervidobacterium sp. 2310opik-2]
MSGLKFMKIKKIIFTFVIFIMLFSILSCVPQRPEPKSNDIYSWKMEILNSPGNVLIKSIEGTLIYVDTSGNGIIHDGKTGIYVYKGGFYSSDKGKKVIISNGIGTTYRDSIQIDMSKGGTKTLQTSSDSISPTPLDVKLDNSDKSRALWDFRYVTVSGFILGGQNSTGDYILSYTTSSNTSEKIVISSLTGALTLPLAYTTEATVTGYLQYSSGKWKLNIMQATLGKQIVGNGIYVDEVIDGLTFTALGKTYKITGIDVSLNNASKTSLENFINENNGLVQVVEGKRDENGAIHVFLFSEDGYKFYQEELLKTGNALIDIDATIDNPNMYERMKLAYKEAYNKKLGVYSTFSDAPTVNSADMALSNVNKFVFVTGTVNDIISNEDRNKTLLVSDWLQINISAGNFKYLFSSPIDSLKNKIVTFYGYLTKPEGTERYTINLRAEWEYFSFAGGTGTKDDPFIIESPLHLISVKAMATQGKYFKLNADIDLEGQEWSPIGTYSTDLTKTAFQGVFDGNNHKISNFVYNNETTGTNAGLFGYLYNATVTNLIIENVTIRAKQRAGTLAGAVKSSYIEKVKVVNANIYASIDGSGYAGGLIGDAGEGTVVKQCAVRNSTITVAKYAGGGLIGQLVSTNASNPALIENCYVEGGEVKSNYSSTTATSGFISNYNVSAGQVRNNYVAIKVTNGQGFVGYIPSGGSSSGASGNYFDKDVAGTSSDKLNTPAKTTAEMKMQSTFVGWDFTNVWIINEGNDYPRLRWE